MLFLSGGPGLSSHSLGPLTPYLSHFDVWTLDPPGTAGLPAPEQNRFLDVVEDAEKALLRDGRPVIAAGFSFGGLYAATIATRGKVPVSAFLGIGSPLSLRSYRACETRYLSGRDATIAEAEASFAKDPSPRSLMQWMSSAVRLYFTEPFAEFGVALFAEERPNARRYLEVSTEFLDARVPEPIAALRALPIPKAIVAGTDDGIVPADELRRDAEAVGAEFILLDGGRHFLQVERAPEVLLTLESLAAQSRIQ